MLEFSGTDAWFRFHLHTPRNAALMSHRINVIVSDDVWRFLKKVPQDERSRTINQALQEWAGKRRRQDAAAGMDRLRNEPMVQPVTTAGIVRWIEEDRGGGH